MTKIKINKLSKHNENINKIVRESIQQALIILMNQKKFNDIESLTCKDSAEGLITNLKTFFGNIWLKKILN